jgi:hypothetical protein
VSESVIELSAPLPGKLQAARLTWLDGAKKPKPTTRERAVSALLEKQNKAGFTDQVVLAIDEADAWLAEADRMQGRAPRRTPRPAPRSTPAPAPRPAPRGRSTTPPASTSPRPRAQTPSPAPRTGSTTPASTGSAGRVPASNRTACSRCGGRLSLIGPRHLVHIEDLDAFYRRAFDPRSLATTTVYEYECGACHRVETFTTAK